MGKLSQRIKKARCPYAAAVIVAAGQGTRFGGNKMTAELGGIPVLIHTLRAFEAAELIREIVVVTRESAMQSVGQLCKAYGVTKLKAIVPGGETRAQSCYAGVMAVSDEADIAAIHDGARPLVTAQVIEDAVWGAYRHDAAAPAIPVRDTVKIARDGVVTETPDRRALFAMQTPQCFQKDLIRAALGEALKNAPDVTDDCAAVERIGGRVWLTRGSEENIKITTPLDVALGEIILKRRQNG